MLSQHRLTMFQVIQPFWYFCSVIKIRVRKLIYQTSSSRYNDFTIRMAGKFRVNYFGCSTWGWYRARWPFFRIPEKNIKRVGSCTIATMPVSLSSAFDYLIGIYHLIVLHVKCGTPRVVSFVKDAASVGARVPCSNDVIYDEQLKLT